MWQINILTLFPDMYPGPLHFSTLGKAMDHNMWKLDAKNIRDFAQNKHKTVDGSPFGGSSGMVLRADVISTAIQSFFIPNGYPIIYLSPKGTLLNQETARSIAQSNNGINILCGRFEGIDERLIKEYNIIEISIGDYVLSSGDIACFTFIDCCLRHVNGCTSNKLSLQEETFGLGKYKNLLEYPHYTKPRIWKSHKVPDVLISGNHKKISEWRLDQAIKTTKERRPDLWIKYLNGVNE